MKYIGKTITLVYLINFSSVILASGIINEKTNLYHSHHKLKVAIESGDHKAPKRGKPIRGNGN